MEDASGKRRADDADLICGMEVAPGKRRANAAELMHDWGRSFRAAKFLYAVGTLVWASVAIGVSTCDWNNQVLCDGYNENVYRAMHEDHHRVTAFEIGLTAYFILLLESTRGPLVVIEVGCGRFLTLTMVLVLLADSIRLTEEQKKRISEMIIICIEGNAEAATIAAATVRRDQRMKGRVNIIAGLSTTPDVILQVRSFIEPVSNAIVVGPVCELLGSLATVEGYEYIVRDLARSFTCISSIPGPDRYATIMHPACVQAHDISGQRGILTRKDVLVDSAGRFCSVQKLDFAKTRTFPKPALLEFITAASRRQDSMESRTTSWRVELDCVCNSLAFFIWFAFDQGAALSSTKFTGFPYGLSCGSGDHDMMLRQAGVSDGSSNVNDGLTANTNWRNFVLWLPYMNLSCGEVLTVHTRVDTTGFNVVYHFEVFRGCDGNHPVKSICLKSTDMIGCDWRKVTAASPVPIVPAESVGRRLSSH